MFQLKCDGNVKELWHGVCKEVIMNRLPSITKVCISFVLHGFISIFYFVFVLVLDALFSMMVYKRHVA